MTYETIRERLLGAAFVLGPLLMLVSVSTLLLGIGRNPGIMSWGSSVEGFIGFYGFILLVPVFLTMAELLGQDKPRFAAVIAVLALIGFAGGGVINMILRVVVADLMSAGVTAEMFEQQVANWQQGTSILLIPIMMGPLAPLSSILLGIGFLWARRMQGRAWLLIVAGVSFLAGQLLVIATEVTYTLALCLWAVVFIPIGLRLLRGEMVGTLHGLSPAMNNAS